MANATNYFVYMGNLIVQERDAANVPAVAYTRGSDLSGSVEGAGGIGGLLARSHGYSGGSWSTHSFYHADGNGNITMLLNSSQSAVAIYRYDPYGNTMASSGTLAGANLQRFSSKTALDIPSMALYYYGERFYAPDLQRWPNRDPIEENGGMNLYGFVGNNPLNSIDLLGLMTRAECQALRGQILRKTADLLDDLRRYSPTDDGKGGFPKHGGGVTKPGGHFDEIMQRKRGLRNDITRYLKECIKCEDDQGPKGGPIPRWIDDMVSRPIPLPVYPSPNPIIYVPGSDGFWEDVGKGGLIVGGGAAIGIGVIVAPEITLPILVPAL